MEDKKTRLRPVVYSTNYLERGAQKTTQQMFLLKALQVTQDPKKLKQMIGVKSVVEVYRTLDKLAMRKEYHEALARAGISFDYIVNGIKKIAENGYKDSDRLNAYKALLKSVGMDSYDSETVGVGGSWEEVLLKKIEETKREKELQLTGGTAILEHDVSSSAEVVPQYEVIVPEVPASARIAQEEEEEMTSSIYDKK